MVMGDLDIRAQRDVLASLVLGLRGLRTAQCHQIIRSAELAEKTAAADKLYLYQRLTDRVTDRLDELVLPGLPTTFRLGGVASWITACIADDLSSDAIAVLGRRVAGLAHELRARSRSLLDAPTHDALGLVTEALAFDSIERQDRAAFEICNAADMTIRDMEAAIAWPEVAMTPGRPHELSVRSKQDCSEHLVELLFQTSSSDDADAIMLRHGLHGLLFNVEIAAMESCAMMLARFQDLPEACAHDIARQCWDESRHAQICWVELNQRGGSLHEFPVHLAIWDKARRGSSAAECLCLQQVLGEGFALGQGLRFQHEFRDRGDTQLAELHERLFFDELLHVRNGVRWFRELAGPEAGELYRRISAELGRTVDLSVGDEIAEFALLRNVVTGRETLGSR
jgi:uncharacterized ferritin-like protein (DUF455 family)